eukprot:4749909-Prymnesium_polylepis.1
MDARGKPAKKPTARRMASATTAPIASKPAVWSASCGRGGATSMVPSWPPPSVAPPPPSPPPPLPPPLPLPPPPPAAFAAG